MSSAATAITATALVCARGGSKGLPGKNLRLLAGEPLVSRAISRARAVQRVDRVIVSTDSEEIAAVAREAGAEVPFLRPAELAQDTSAEWRVWQHAIRYLIDSGSRPEALLVVPPTAPLRSVLDLDRCLDEYARGDADIVITVTDAHRSPYFNMVSQRSDGTVGLVIPPASSVVRRQDAPACYDMATVAYVANPEFVLHSEGLFDGRVRAVHVPPERAIDIDTALDLRIAECLIASATATAGAPLG